MLKFVHAVVDGAIRFPATWLTRRRSESIWIAPGMMVLSSRSRFAVVRMSSAELHEMVPPSKSGIDCPTAVHTFPLVVTSTAETTMRMGPTASD
ncbi:MAG: hypothetical protein Q8R01_02215 [Ramlibacter sp.]|nr:hypothetical protein [Ramlibacter sp.]